MSNKNEIEASKIHWTWNVSCSSKIDRRNRTFIQKQNLRKNATFVTRECKCSIQKFLLYFIGCYRWISYIGGAIVHFSKAWNQYISIIPTTKTFPFTFWECSNCVTSDACFWYSVKIDCPILTPTPIHHNIRYRFFLDSPSWTLFTLSYKQYKRIFAEKKLDETTFNF